MKSPGEEKPFADVNPFLQLDRSLFRDAKKRNAQHAGGIKHKKAENILHRPDKKNITDDTEANSTSYADMINPDNNNTDDETFIQAMEGVKPLGGKGRTVAPGVTPRQLPKFKEPSLEDLIDSKLEFIELHKGEYMEGYVVGLDAIIMQKLRAGAYSSEANLDLHGLNAEQAFMALRDFLRRAWHKGVRMGLVVTGRGRNSPQGMGVLRDKMYLWLTQEPFKRIVLAFCTARPADGGPGSIYILLRKYKKKGKVFWDRLPPDPF